MLIVKALNHLKGNGEEFQVRELNCDVEEVYSDDIGLIDVLKQVSKLEICKIDLKI